MDVHGVGRVGQGWADATERADRIPGLTAGGEIAKDAADQAGELKGVPGSLGDDDLRMIGQGVDGDIAVGGHGVEAGPGGAHGTENTGDVPRQETIGTVGSAGVRFEGARLVSHDVAADIDPGLGRILV